MWEEETVTVTHNGWSLVIGWDAELGAWSMNVNGVEMRALPEAPKTAAQLPEINRSQDEPFYSDTIR